MPRPEQLGLRDTIVSGHVKGARGVVGLTGSPTATGIAGTPGLGKTTTAIWLARDPVVRSAFRANPTQSSGEVQRRAPVVTAAANVGARSEKNCGDVRIPLLARHVQRCRQRSAKLKRRLAVDVRARIEQRDCKLKVTESASGVE